MFHIQTCKNCCPYCLSISTCGPHWSPTSKWTTGSCAQTDNKPSIFPKDSRLRRANSKGSHIRGMWFTRKLSWYDMK